MDTNTPVTRRNVQAFAIGIITCCLVMGCNKNDKETTPRVAALEHNEVFNMPDVSATLYEAFTNVLNSKNIPNRHMK